MPLAVSCRRKRRAKADGWWGSPLEGNATISTWKLVLEFNKPTSSTRATDNHQQVDQDWNSVVLIFIAHPVAVQCRLDMAQLLVACPTPDLVGARAWPDGGAMWNRRCLTPWAWRLEFADLLDHLRQTWFHPRRSDTNRTGVAPTPFPREPQHGTMCQQCQQLDMPLPTKLYTPPCP